MPRYLYMSEMEAEMTSRGDYLAFKRERSRRDRGKEKSYSLGDGLGSLPL